jgi:hypothetical protein
MTDGTANTQQSALHLPSIPGIAVDLFDAASLALALAAAFAIKFVATAVAK